MSVVGTEAKLDRFVWSHQSIKVPICTRMLIFGKQAFFLLNPFRISNQIPKFHKLRVCDIITLVPKRQTGCIVEVGILRI